MSTDPFSTTKRLEVIHLGRPHGREGGSKKGQNCERMQRLEKGGGEVDES